MLKILWMNFYGIFETRRLLQNTRLLILEVIRIRYDGNIKFYVFWYVNKLVCTGNINVNATDDNDKQAVIVVIHVLLSLDDRYNYDGLALRCVARDSYNILPERNTSILINLSPCQSNITYYDTLVIPVMYFLLVYIIYESI